MSPDKAAIFLRHLIFQQKRIIFAKNALFLPKTHHFPFYPYSYLSHITTALSTSADVAVSPNARVRIKKAFKSLAANSFMSQYANLHSGYAYVWV